MTDRLKLKMFESVWKCAPHAYTDNSA